MIPMGLVMMLPPGVRNPTNSILLRVNQGELTQGHPIDQNFWLYFDIKKGLTISKFTRLGANEQNWFGSKLQFSGIDPATQSIAGYGENLIDQIFGTGKFIHELRVGTRHQSWQQVFCLFLEGLVWIFAATPKLVT
jgi:hypothetical protein